MIFSQVRIKRSLVNWAACGQSSLCSIFFSGVFLGSCSGVCRPALLILTLFQSYIYKVDLREYPPGILV